MPRPRAAVIFHFFAHYRRPVVEALSRSRRAEFTFIGDDHEYLHSIEPMQFDGSIRFIRAPTHHLFGPFMWQWGAIRWAVSRRFDTVIMHAVPHWPCTWVGAILARLTGKRVLFWGHGYLARPRGLKGLVRRVFYAIPHEHLFYGNLSKAYALELGWPPERLHVIYNSMDADRQRSIRASWSREDRERLRRSLFSVPEGPVIGCTTRLIPMRRLHELIEAAALLRSRGMPARLLIVGDGPERKRLERLSERLAVPVHFEGACYEETRIGHLIMSCDVTVSPGKTGLTAIHSLGYGVPVVSHEDPDDQGPEWEAIIPGRTGALFKPGDVESLAAAIEPWIRPSESVDAVRKACIGIVERLWNPAHQSRAIERAVCGRPANDLLHAEPRHDD